MLGELGGQFSLNLIVGFFDQLLCNWGDQFAHFKFTFRFEIDRGYVVLLEIKI